jgi:hypothetical protein
MSKLDKYVNEMGFSYLLEDDEDDYAWLELDHVPDKTVLPLDVIRKNHPDEDDVMQLMRLFTDDNYLHFATKHLLNVELPPYQCATLDVLWRKKLAILVANRGFSKSFLMAVYSLLRMLLTPNAKIVVVSASFRQARGIFDYMCDIWDKAPILRDITGGKSDRSGPKKSIDKCEFRIGDSTTACIPLGDGCLAGNTLITLNDRFSHMKSVASVFNKNETTINQTNRMVWGDGQFRLSDEGYYNGFVDTIKVKTKLGFEYTGTPNHRMRLVRKGNVCQVRTDNMRVGDNIILDTSFRWHDGSCNWSKSSLYELGRRLIECEVFPADLLNSSREEFNNVLKGLVDQSGAVINGALVIKGLSEDIRRVLKYILLHYSIVAIDINTDLVINETYFKYMSMFLGEKHFYERGNYQINVPDQVVDEIVEISPSKDMTWDVHIPETHEYCANGFFSHNTKIRGLRANYIICDEYSSVEEHIFNVVIQGFGSVSLNPIEKVKMSATMNKLKRAGMWTEELEELHKASLGGNQMILSGTAYYEFNHFYRTYMRWRKVIESIGSKKKMEEVFGTDRSLLKAFDPTSVGILQVPYTAVPDDFLDTAMIAQAKMNLSSAQFNMEYGARFQSDTDGFFRRSLIEATTCHKPLYTINGEKVHFTAMNKGTPGSRYILAIDPAAHVDNAAMVVLEDCGPYRKVVYCWSTNKSIFDELRKKGIASEDDYYQYLGQRIRKIVNDFNIDHILIDKNGGGTSVVEVLGSATRLKANEEPIYEIINYDEPKHTDDKPGRHIIELVKPTNEYNSKANHGLLKDLQDKALIFPFFDTVEIERQILMEKEMGIDFDSYEDMAVELEELKYEMTLVVCTPTPGGLENFDTPSVKTDLAPGVARKGRMRKDRYSALLMANTFARERHIKVFNEVPQMTVVGSNKTGVITPNKANFGKMYYGAGTGWLGNNRGGGFGHHKG